MDRPTLNHVYIAVSDMAAALAFYRRLGLDIPEGTPAFARASMPGGAGIEFGTAELTRGYDTAWQQPAGYGSAQIQLDLPSRDAVDAMYADMTGAGYTGHLAPIDAFWGSRFAILQDPDGNLIGLHSPRDPSMGGPPPVD